MGDPLPDFLVVGSQKCGTTTLYFDLLTSPHIYFPIEKEPANLCDPAVLTPTGRAAYARLYRGATPGQRRGDASTHYTMGTNSAGAATRARTLLDDDLRIFYMIRDPVARVRSHYRHLWALEQESAPISTAIRRRDEYIRNSQFAQQLAPWRERFGSQVRVLPFGDFIKDRRGTARLVASDLGIPPFDHLIRPDEVFNASDGKRRVPRAWRGFLESNSYQHHLRPLLSPRLRIRLQVWLLPRANPPPDDTLSRDDVRFLLDRLEADINQHGEVLGIAPWTVDTLWKRHGHGPP